MSTAIVRPVEGDGRRDTWAIPWARRREMDVANVALMVLTIVTGVTMGRLFTNATFLVPVVACAIAAHATAWAVRETKLPSAAGVALPVAAATLVAVWFVLPSSTAGGIPWRGTWDAAIAALQSARQDFVHAVAPVPPTKGFVFAAALGVGLIAVFADWAAFRLRSAYEAVLPALGLFVLVAVLGGDRYRWQSVAAVLAAALAFLAIHGGATRALGTPWFASRSSVSRQTLLQGTIALIGVAVFAAVVIGPRLPGAQAAGFLDWRTPDDGSGRRTTISPLVDIRGRLVEQSNVEVFSVRATSRSYWRLTSLDTFNGVIWSSNDNYRKATGRLPSSGAVPPAEGIGQSFAISSLSSIWLPAAFRPVELQDADGVSFNADSSSLISKEPTSDGLTYRVVSERPSLTAAGLARAPALSSRSLDRYLTLPPISPRVVRLARDVAGAQPTPYGKARVLQDFLRRHARYDTEVDQGHGEDALERFLFVTRRGYCEQFSAAFAVMARVLGLPSRVAVGFTPGEVGADGTYRVLGLHAHAWPEVYLDGFGWVAFEPTPGRGAPGAQDYTGVPESQASAARPDTSTTALPTTTVPVGAGATSSTATTAPLELLPPPQPKSRSRGPLVIVALAIVAALTAWLVGAPILRRSRRARRRGAARTAAERILVAWAEADDALSLADARRKPSETLQEHARRAQSAVPERARGALAGLARSATEASYAPAIPPDLAGAAISAAATVEEAVEESVGRARRIRRELSLRG